LLKYIYRFWKLLNIYYLILIARSHAAKCKSYRHVPFDMFVKPMIWLSYHNSSLFLNLRLDVVFLFIQVHCFFPTPTSCIFHLIVNLRTHHVHILFYYEQNNVHYFQKQLNDNNYVYQLTKNCRFSKKKITPTRKQLWT
jgi:hypothetical protein